MQQVSLDGIVVDGVKRQVSLAGLSGIRLETVGRRLVLSPPLHPGRFYLEISNVLPSSGTVSKQHKRRYRPPPSVLVTLGARRGDRAVAVVRRWAENAESFGELLKYILKRLHRLRFVRLTGHLDEAFNEALRRAFTARLPLVQRLFARSQESGGLNLAGLSVLALCHTALTRLKLDGQLKAFDGSCCARTAWTALATLVGFCHRLRSLVIRRFPRNPVATVAELQALGSACLCRLPTLVHFSLQHTLLGADDDDDDEGDIDESTCDDVLRSAFGQNPLLRLLTLAGSVAWLFAQPSAAAVVAQLTFVCLEFAAEDSDAWMNEHYNLVRILQSLPAHGQLRFIISSPLAADDILALLRLSDDTKRAIRARMDHPLPSSPQEKVASPARKYFLKLYEHIRQLATDDQSELPAVAVEWVGAVTAVFLYGSGRVEIEIIYTTD